MTLSLYGLEFYDNGRWVEYGDSMYYNRAAAQREVDYLEWIYGTGGFRVREYPPVPSGKVSVEADFDWMTEGF